MKLRHVRAVAACALVVVALTGARGSHGGGCGHSSSSSSSSSSGGSSSDGGYSSSGSSDGGYSSSSSSSSGSSTGGVPTPSSTTSAESDVRITECKVDRTAGKVTATLSITNGNSTGKSTYIGNVKFTDSTGSYLGVAQISSEEVPAGANHPVTVTGTYLSGSDNQASGKCTVSYIAKVNSVS
ncbi:hypothetical protein AB0D04_07090 [Streptomyces sp. NPDC048483]|uniref:hypothetical protein n=1 Tax=Streptomyces sp. NPDC048483 TaxID=3154927 RepID=UPI00341C8063